MGDRIEPTIAAVETISAAESNPLLAEWVGPYGGIPAFRPGEESRISNPRLKKRWPKTSPRSTSIAADTAAPTFENTIAALERTGRTLDRVRPIYGIWSSNMSSPEFQAVEREMAPKLAAFTTRSRRTRRSSSASRPSTTRPRKRSSRPSSSAWPGSTTRISCAPARGSTPEPKARLSEINQQLGKLYTNSARTCSPTRTSNISS